VNQFFDTPIEFLKGVGPERSKLLRSELGCETFKDLLFHFPFRHVDRTDMHSITDIATIDGNVQLRGRFISWKMAGRPGSQRLSAKFEDATGTIDLVWFQAAKWIQPKLKQGIEFVVFGKATMYNNKYNMSHPEFEEWESYRLKLGGNLEPVYNTSEKMKARGLDSKAIAKLTRALCAEVKGQFPESYSEDFRAEHKLVGREFALFHIHYPKDQDHLQHALHRLKFEELFMIQLRLLMIKIQHSNKYSGFNFNEVGTQFNVFYKDHLPFELTDAQKRVIREIRHDLGSGTQMNRLLQGDVGSGKTVVSLLTMLLAIDNGFQACMMAPTEILAEQHYNSITKMLSGLPITVGLLTGSATKAERTTLHTALRSGFMKILIGTHALLEDVVQFEKLGLVCIDEQHRFGVKQRAKLWAKGTRTNEDGGASIPHILVMTATPIPRTLAMTLYGDLDISVIDELPPGRKPILTSHRRDAHRLRLFGFMKDVIDKGGQVYVVYPLIDESDSLDYKFLTDGYESIVRSFPMKQYQVGILHGRLKSDEKEAEMQRFKDGKTQILVSTTVIEVGVDVPNASVMVIESSERFGLSQLHQLRGRVGRGADQSYCILMTKDELSADAQVRIDTMCKTNDGFEIAEVDMRLRGPGDMAGTQQSGVPDLKVADLIFDAHLIQLARDAASSVLDEDPDLMLDKNSGIRGMLEDLVKGQPNWGRIS
jgi:ATP-dependent DNA helicase RecG